LPSAPRRAASRGRPPRSVLDELLAGAEPAAPAPPEAGAAADGRTEAPAGRATRRMTINLPAALLERARDAVYHSPWLSLSSLAAGALSREIGRLEEERGEPFPDGMGRCAPAGGSVEPSV
jgi:hypothetical protein